MKKEEFEIRIRVGIHKDELACGLLTKKQEHRIIDKITEIAYSDAIRKFKL